MNANPLRIVVILGTNRDGRESEHVARYIMGALDARTDMEATLFDVRDYSPPTNDYGQALKKQEPFSEYRDAIIAADGIIIVTPEYNHGYPGTLKSLLDVVLREYIHKAVAFAGVSASRIGGARVIENLLPVVRELGLVASSVDLQFPHVDTLFDETGTLTDEAYHERTEKFLSELGWLAQSLQWGRNNVASPIS